MRTAILVIVIVVAVLVGITMTLRTQAKTGMPSEDVLKRATQRARELDAQEKSDDEQP